MRQTTAAVTAALLGAGAMYAFDPKRQGGRWTFAGDLADYARRASRGLFDEDVRRDLAERARELGAQARSLLEAAADVPGRVVAEAGSTQPGALLPRVVAARARARGERRHGARSDPRRGPRGRRSAPLGACRHRRRAVRRDGALTGPERAG